MDIETLRIFTVVAENGTFTNAARILFSNQSSISRRIKALEDELGTPLFRRSKGQSAIELTQYGTEFLTYARTVLDMTRDITSIADDMGRMYLSIGCIEPFNNRIFLQFYKQFITRHPEICLSIHTYHSTEIYGRIENLFLDLGYVIYDRQRPEVDASLLYREPLVIVSKGPNNYYDGIPAEKLPADQEIYIRRNDAYHIIHEQHFPGKRYRMRVSTDALTIPFLDTPGAWTVLPQSTALVYAEQENLKINYPGFGIPTQKCYEIVHKQPRSNRLKAIEVFREEFHKYIDENILTILNITE